MVKIIPTEFQQRIKERNEKIVTGFSELKNDNPSASNTDCIRGLADKFKVNAITIKRALKEGGML